MTSKQISGWMNSKYILAVLLGVIIVFFLVTSLVDNRFKQIELNTRVQIADQEKILVAIAETTARNGADEVTESIVRDCSVDERTRFDELLGRLDAGLARADLVELERLFGRCGSFFSERKAVMTARLSREIEIYTNYVNHLSVVLDEDLTTVFKVAEWEQLSAEESKQSELFAKLVALQDEIIAELLAGTSPSSEEMSEILTEVREVQETLVVTKKQAEKTRATLVSL